MLFLVDSVSFPNMDEYDSDSDSDPAEDFPPSRQEPPTPQLRPQAPQPAPRIIPAFDRAAKPKPQPSTIPTQPIDKFINTTPITPTQPPQIPASQPHTGPQNPTPQPQYNRALKPAANSVNSSHEVRLCVTSRLVFYIQIGNDVNVR